MLVYIDAEYKCHTENNGTMTAVDTKFFNGKCKEFIEGYLFVPSGEIWTREDGRTFDGELIMPWRPYAELKAAQHAYERELAEAARILLGEVSA